MEISASELRQEKINTHAVVLRALGGVDERCSKNILKAGNGNLRS